MARGKKPWVTRRNKSRKTPCDKGCDTAEQTATTTEQGKKWDPNTAGEEGWLPSSGLTPWGRCLSSARADPRAHFFVFMVYKNTTKRKTRKRQKRLIPKVNITARGALGTPHHTRSPVQWRRTHVWASASAFARPAAVAVAAAASSATWAGCVAQVLPLETSKHATKRFITFGKIFQKRFGRLTQNPTSIPARPVIYAHASLPALLPSSLSPPLVISRHHDITQLSGPEPPTSLPLPTPPRRQGSDGPAGGHQLAVVVLAQEG